MAELHRIMTEHPEWVALDEEEAELRTIETEWRKRNQEERSQYEKAQREWLTIQRDALDAGEQVPPPPDPPPNRVDEAHHYLGRHAAITQKRQDLLASLAPEVEASAAEREQELLDAVSILVDQLRPLAAELSSLLATVRAVVQAAQRADGRERPLPRHSVGVAELVEIVLRGESLIDTPRKQKVRLQ